jgi:hypothetical protein
MFRDATRSGVAKQISLGRQPRSAASASEPETPKAPRGGRGTKA